MLGRWRDRRAVDPAQSRRLTFTENPSCRYSYRYRDERAHGSSGKLAITAPDAAMDVMIAPQPMNIVQAAADLLWSAPIKQYPDLTIALSEGGTGCDPVGVKNRHMIGIRQHLLGDGLPVTQRTPCAGPTSNRSRTSPGSGPRSVRCVRPQRTTMSPSSAERARGEERVQLRRLPGQRQGGHRRPRLICSATVFRRLQRRTKCRAV